MVEIMKQITATHTVWHIPNWSAYLRERRASGLDHPLSGDTPPQRRHCYSVSHEVDEAMRQVGAWGSLDDRQVAQLFRLRPGRYRIVEA